MSPTPQDPPLADVWVAMAEHFLDTETRHTIPMTALCCVEAGLSTASARDEWRSHVVPAVGFNVLLVAGEWAMWDRRWLLDRIASLQARGPLARGIGGLLRVRHVDGVFEATSRMIDVLRTAEDSAAQRILCQDLEALARYYFDFCPRAWTDVEVGRRREVYRTFFLDAIAPALVQGEAEEADSRVKAALGDAARLGPAA